MTGETDDEQPWGTGDRHGGYDHEHARDAALDCDHAPASGSNREADVDRSDERQTKGVNRGGIEPSESERRRRLDASKDQTPQHWWAQSRAYWLPQSGLGHQGAVNPMRRSNPIVG